MTTMDNAEEAYAGESQANRKYEIFSEKAAAEGYPNVAKLFKAASEAEAIHAKRLLLILNKLGSTEENLKGSVAGETEEYTEMYPAFIKTANEEGQKEAATVFTHAMKAEEVHAGRYEKALEAVSAGDDFEASKIYLCPVCGNIEIDSIPERCPICGVPARMFREVE
ncbi:rubrerythrin family protein [Methanoplanus endosymbiosus]|uniref:Rubrerythrin family protein n=1 Tax=Methanoplanus endosymbiosus TaxID=33865 RepID=A0A9E7PK29_9EURY|nr:rubrerythrin family protein [Methanoplanus endosymbiosus]UUX91460.1 rubrerythrin family protein [Methanoplanus endosymbiosus]